MEILLSGEMTVPTKKILNRTSVKKFNLSAVIKTKMEQRKAGTFLFMHEKEPSYNDLKDGKWPENTEDYWCIHSVASGMKVKGVASFIFSWCENQPGVKCIKIDTHRNNLPMRHLVEKNGYIYCGHCYYYEDVETDDGIVQDFERIAFCKVLKK